MSQRVFIPIVAALAALGLVACGGDGGSDEDPAIKRAVEQAYTTKDAALKCDKLATQSFVKRVYGEVAQCRKAEAPESDDKPPTAVKSSDLEVDGDAATVKIRLVGGDTAGASGTLQLRKEGGDWRVDDLGVDLLRSQVTTGLTSDSAPPALRDPKVVACTRKAFLDLADPELRRIAYLSIGETGAGEAELGKLLGPCLSIPSSGGVSALRKQFESGITSKARKDGMSQSTIDCINKQLRRSISDEEISKLAFSNAKPTAAMQRSIVETFGRCQGRSGSQGSTVLREYFEQGVREAAAKRDVSKQALVCVIRRLRSTISDDEIIAATTSARVKARLSRKTAAELIRCGAVRSS